MTASAANSPAKTPADVRLSMAAAAAAAGKAVASPDLRLFPDLLLRNKTPAATAAASTLSCVSLDLVEPDEPAFVEALQLALATPSGKASVEDARRFIEYANARSIQLLGAVVLRRTCRSTIRCIWSSVVTLPPGGTATMMAAPEVPKVARPLLSDAVAQSAELACDRGATSIQVLLPCSSVPSPLQTLCREASFEPLTELIYLHRRVPKTVRLQELPSGFRLETYDPKRRECFKEALRRSYIDTLDCPELTNRRGLDDILDGHQSAGTFDPADWHVLLDSDDEPCGILLLSGLGMTGTDGTEIVYLGLCPTVRGRGLAGRMMEVAEATASKKVTRWLAVAVDARNTPGLKLYTARGAKPAEVRLAMHREF